MELVEAFWEPGLSRQVVPTLAEFQWKQTDWGLMLNNSDSKGPETPQFIMDHYLLRMYYCYNLLASASVFFDRNLVLSREAFSCDVAGTEEYLETRRELCSHWFTPQEWGPCTLNYHPAAPRFPSAPFVCCAHTAHVWEIHWAPTEHWASAKKGKHICKSSGHIWDFQLSGIPQTQRQNLL